MIKINFADNKLPIALVVAAKHLQDIFDSLEKDIDQLPIVTFDPLYTKPAGLTSVDIISEALYENEIEIKIRTYTQSYLSYKFSPVNAMVKASEPSTVYFNTRMFKGWNKSVLDYMESLSHECCHVFDAFSSNTFNHGTNSLNGKSNTAPVKLASVLVNLKTPRTSEALA